MLEAWITPGGIATFQRKVWRFLKRLDGFCRPVDFHRPSTVEAGAEFGYGCGSELVGGLRGGLVREGHLVFDFEISTDVEEDEAGFGSAGNGQMAGVAADPTVQPRTGGLAIMHEQRAVVGINETAR